MNILTSHSWQGISAIIGIISLAVSVILFVQDYNKKGLGSLLFFLFAVFMMLIFLSALYVGFMLIVLTNIGGGIYTAIWPHNGEKARRIAGLIWAVVTGIGGFAILSGWHTIV